MLRVKKRMSLLVLAVFMLTMVLGGCGVREGSPGVTPAGDEPGGGTAELAFLQEQAFAALPPDYVEDFTPAVPAYTVAKDFSNVVNWERWGSRLPDEYKEALRQNGFVVTYGGWDEFFNLYEMNRYDDCPNFITTDAMLHTYHLFFSRMLKSVEKEHFIATLTELNRAMLEGSEAQYKELKGTQWENAALRNAAFFAVGGQLLDPQAAAPAVEIPQVEEELALIMAAEGIRPSPVLNLGAYGVDGVDLLQEDYTQYIPRSHYTSSEELSRYFRAMMWYGRMSLRQSNEDECRSALLMTLALNEGDNLTRWRQIYDVTNFFVGESDDLGVYDYAPVIAAAYGEEVKVKDLPEQTEQWRQYMAGIKALPAPAINSIPIFDEDIQPDREAAIKGFRFMGQRFSLDASIFQRLVYREVGENAAGERRMLPSGMDIPAALGSETAIAILEAEGATGFDGYLNNMVKVQRYIKGVSAELWNQNLYWSWLNTLRPLAEDGARGEGYPAFMQNDAWAAKELNTFLGSWAELKHDTLLYVKQMYAEMGGGSDEEIDDRGYVEPNPAVYARLASLSTMSAEGLEARGLLAERDKESLERLAELALRLQVIAQNELQNQALTDEDYELIRTFGGQLEHFWYEALRDEKGGAEIYHRDYPAAIIADVATDPNGQVLEVGTGGVDNIWAIVPVDGSLRLAKGGVFSYYEFAWPMADRLTDAKWRLMLGMEPTFVDGEFIQVEPPARPEWTEAFLTERQ